VAAIGLATVNVVLIGTDVGGRGEGTHAFTVRMLGDVNYDNTVDAQDKLEINKSLNGLATLPGITVRDLDLTGDGVNVDAQDKLIINQILNGLTVP
jgi:hypothetical protein